MFPVNCVGFADETACLVSAAIRGGRNCDLSADGQDSEILVFSHSKST